MTAKAHTIPKNMTAFTYEQSWVMSQKRCDYMWETLQLRETFVRGQLWPYRVEFMADSQKGAFKAAFSNQALA